jgi:cytochrome c5
MKVRSYVLPIALLVMLLIITACGSSAATSQPAGSSATSAPANSSALDGKALVQERCTVCHSLARVENTGRTAAEWKTVVEQMVKGGAVLNADEQTAVIDYLAKTYPK